MLTESISITYTISCDENDRAVSFSKVIKTSIYKDKEFFTSVTESLGSSFEEVKEAMQYW